MSADEHGDRDAIPTRGPGRRKAEQDAVPTTRGRRQSPPGPASPLVSVTTKIRAKRKVRGDLSLPDEDLPPGTISKKPGPNRYATLGEIARGGMGAVIKIVDNDIRRPMAMKVVLGGADADRLGRFVEE
ncbi:MAG: hypothetical protein ACYTHN_19635, partial [Planctomycetota bacterium]